MGVPPNVSETEPLFSECATQRRRDTEQPERFVGRAGVTVGLNEVRVKSLAQCRVIFLAVLEICDR